MFYFLFSEGIVSKTNEIEEIHKFKCDCEMCTHLDLMLKITVNEAPKLKINVKVSNLAQDAARSKDPKKMKDILEQSWKSINDDPTFPKIMYSIYMEAKSFLTIITSYLTYQFI